MSRLPIRLRLTAVFAGATIMGDGSVALILDTAGVAGSASLTSNTAKRLLQLNGQTGVGNPNRQGFESAVRGEGSPLNVLRWHPGQGRYSPLWDVHIGLWSAAAVAARQNTRQTDYGDILGLAEHHTITNPDGTPFSAAGIIVDCPLVSRG